ncbi:MAG: xanthan lyase [Bacteroidaceae bacterium]|nr:xanthan lyase [Bacteroidaceae bacterium]
MRQRGRTFITVLAAMLVVSLAHASASSAVSDSIREQVQSYFDSFQSDVHYGKLTVRKVSFRDADQCVDIDLSQTFSYLRFRRSMVDSIYAGIHRILPDSYSEYSISVRTNGYSLEDQIPLWSVADTVPEYHRVTSSPVRNKAAWVRNSSRQFIPDMGLEGVAMAVTPSHGYYYDSGDTLWEFQRPPLYCSREDLLTQSLAYPFLIPMLENAGAVVVCERERDWQCNSVIVGVDNGGVFKERGSWTDVRNGGYSSDSARIMPDGFDVRTRVAVTGDSRNRSTAMWVPDIPESGEYAVYVTYRSDSTRISDARYIVYHSGGSTIFHVNQKVGGGTWVYLGTFHFDKGRSPEGMVSLDNSSRMSGTVSADAVRFGGGMHTETKNGITLTAPLSMFGTKYYGRFAGAPDYVTAYYEGLDDYREDIWARPLMANWLAGTSAYNEKSPGLGVPLEMYFSLHTDAGYRYGDTIHGSLGICTTDYNDGVLATGESRLRSRDWADMAVSELIRDFKAATGRDWGWRGIWDKNYCESRVPSMQSILVELLSHQNYWDMKLALDPNFQFMAARSIYKSILKENVAMHDRPYVVQPLPVSNFRISRTGDNLLLQWSETADSLEPSANPDFYIVYQSIDGKGFDNGISVNGKSFRMAPEPDHIYRFKVVACNRGGQSMDSEILSASIVKGSKKTALVVNGFQRLGPPATVESDTTLGFDIKADAGIQYKRSPILCGSQQVFDKTCLDLDETIQTGASDTSLEGRIMAGNSFDYPYVHGRALVQAGWSFVSCSRESFMDGQTDAQQCQLVDLILGFQKSSPTDSTFRRDYSCFPEKMRVAIDSYLTDGGNLLVSGSYVASDLGDDASMEFARNCLYYSMGHGSIGEDCQAVEGRKIPAFEIMRENSSDCLGVGHPDILQAEGIGEILFSYENSALPAGIGANPDSGRSVVLGFPFECINSEHERNRVMRYIMNYLF